MMSIGTLMAYTIVAVCVLVLRYRQEKSVFDSMNRVTTPQIWKQIFNLNFIKEPNVLTSTITNISIVIFCTFTAILCLLLDTDWDRFTVVHSILIAITIILLTLFLVVVRQPQCSIDLSFRVPMVPFLPMLSIFLNLYLMFQLDINTWIRFCVWLLIGYFIYFTYGLRSSVEGMKEKMELSEHGKNGFDSKCTSAVARPVVAHTMQSMDDLHNANIDFVNGSTTHLGGK